MSGYPNLPITLRPIGRMQPLPYVQADARATVGAVPYERLPFARGIEEVAGLTPGAQMYPDFVYNVATPANGVEQCVTNLYGSSDQWSRNCSRQNVEVACAAKPNPCIDSITRGLLSGLTPILTPGESVYD